LWVRLRQKDAQGVVFRRQHAVGPYVLDFYCVKARLAVGIDGEIHEREDHPQKDALRDEWLRVQNIWVYRVAAKAVYDDADEVAFGIRALAVARIKKKEQFYSFPVYGEGVVTFSSFYLLIWP